ncbi:selenophosphate synthase [Methylobacterium sp. PvR107]|nr:selenophosphate synthase [Methylobacterium sp. PvR107]
MPDAPRLTSLAHGGGCGCELDPAVLRRLLAQQPAAGPFDRLLVGNETPDDAATGFGILGHGLDSPAAPG